MADDVTQRVIEQYPSLAFLLGDPEIGPLLIQAVDPNVGFSPQTFEARLHETNWWKTTPAPAREELIQANTDPATFWAEAGAYGDELQAIASERFGVWLDPAQRLWLTAYGQNAGLAPSSASMLQYIRQGVASTGTVLSGQGVAGAAKSQVESVIRGEWFAPIADLNWLAKTGADIAQGVTTLDSIRAQMQSQAWNMYPHLRQQITEGQTLADIFNPYRQIIAEELEMGSVEAVDMNSPEWRRLLDWRDPNSGEARLPTASEVQRLARDRRQWWDTSKGRAADAGMTRTILEAFGKVSA